MQPVVQAPFRAPVDRRSALDRAHRGDIVGALGRVRSDDAGPRLTLRRQLGTLLAVMGPGIFVMAADNDAGTVSVYAQAGQNYGLKFLWPLFLLAPVLFVIQEMVARLGSVTGSGHARLIFERFGRRWGWFALGDLLVLNLLTIVTELIGVRLALGYFGVSRYLSVPLAVVALVALTGSGRFRRWEAVMYVLVSVNIVVVPLALLSHPRVGAIAHALVPAVSTQPSAGGVLFLVALVGTTVSSWQLFFHQSNVVDKRITPRWLRYERVDTLLGTVAFVIVGTAMLGICAFAFAGTNFGGRFTDAGAVAHALNVRLGAPAGGLFALMLLNASLLGAAAVTLSTSYAVGDVLGLRHSLHRRWRDAPAFHGSFAVTVAIAGAVVLAPHAPLGLVTTVVQALAGVLLPSATIFLLLLCNDPAVLGPWVNPRWLNALASTVVGSLLVLSALLTATTLFPTLSVELAAIVLLSALALALALVGVGSRRSSHIRNTFEGTPWERATWSMPPLELLAPPQLTRARQVGLVVLRVYIAIAVVLLVVRAASLA